MSVFLSRCFEHGLATRSMISRSRSTAPCTSLSKDPLTHRIACQDMRHDRLIVFFQRFNQCVFTHIHGGHFFGRRKPKL